MQIASVSVRRLALAGGIGSVSGLFGAYSYYSDTLNPFAHSLGIWVLVTALVSAGRLVREAVASSVLALFCAVVAFYVGRSAMYSLLYGGAFHISSAKLALWCLIAAVAGTGLGCVFHRIGHTGWAGAVATAAVIGLLVADAFRRGISYPDEAPLLLGFAVVASLLIWRMSERSGIQTHRFAVLIVPAIVIGLAIVSVPDLLEQVTLMFLGG